LRLRSPSAQLCAKKVADRQGKTVHDVVLAIDRERGQTTLTTAIRVYIVRFLQEALHPSGVA